VLRAAFEAPADGRQAARHQTAAALNLLRAGLGGYAVATRQ
jgi:hypothetical protein